MALTTEQIRTANLREAIVERLAALGVSTRREISAISAAIDRRYGIEREADESSFEFLERALKLLPEPRSSSSGRVAAYRTPPEFRPLRPAAIPHLRQAELDAMPHQISMGGVGNGIERGPGSSRWNR